MEKIDEMAELAARMEQMRLDIKELSEMFSEEHETSEDKALKQRLVILMERCKLDLKNLNEMITMKHKMNEVNKVKTLKKELAILIEPDIQLFRSLRIETREEMASIIHFIERPMGDEKEKLEIAIKTLENKEDSRTKDETSRVLMSLAYKSDFGL
uniref:Uncharacterized protein n=1 Tax=Marseillevirus LCMAC101 TaxID=2506602 RepID=A0A481YSY7_9VIRU|nr:MAG: hypothetical protein LCMAC101_01990 [Marseillevirus LCMAC101]